MKALFPNTERPPKARRRRAGALPELADIAAAIDAARGLRLIAVGYSHHEPLAEAAKKAVEALHVVATMFELCAEIQAAARNVPRKRNRAHAKAVPLALTELEGAKQ